MSKYHHAARLVAAGFTVGEFETRNFAFMVFGADSADCDRLRGRHAGQYGADPDYYSRNRDGATFYDASVGSAFRDREPV